MKIYRLLTSVWPLLLSLTLLIGCATQQGADSAKRPPTTSVEIFRDGQKPAKPYKEIGLLTDDGGLGEQKDIEAKFIKKAKAMGGNALILSPLVRTGAEMKPFTFTLTDTYLYKASVVVYE